MAFSLLHELTVFSLFPIIIGDIIQRTAAAAIDQQVTDGGQFLERIVHGEKISQNPGYLLFTAPYKLCEGGCENDDENFAMAFPLYIGKQGLEKYNEIYPRDHKSIHSEKPNAPFKKRPTQKLFTLCPSGVTPEKTTEMTTETETPAFETLSTTETETKMNETTATTKSETTTNEITTESKYSTAETNSESETSTNEYKITTESKITSTETAATTGTILTTESVSFTSINKETVYTAPEIFINLQTDTFITESSINTNTETSEDSDTPTTITSSIPSTHFIHTTLAKTISETPLPVLTTINSERIKHKPRPNFETEDTKEIETLPTKESDEFQTTETTQLSTDVTETEDITFELYTEGDYTDTTFVTNSNGVRCPPKKCGKKKVTPTIITLLVRNRPDAMKYDGRNADWNSDYSDLQDSLDFD